MSTLPERRAPDDLASDDAGQRRWASKWRRIRDELVEQGTWAEQDADTLDDYVRCLAMAAELRQVILSEGAFSVGSQGQQVKHPAVAMYREAQQDAKALRKDLIYTAAARAAREVGGGAGAEDDALERILAGGDA